jgi:hypothetical protein
MLDRDACERRVYRLSALLTGDERRAARVIASVVGAKPDLRSLDGAHLDRLTVLRSRELKPGDWKSAPLTDRQRAAVRALNRQQREAWVLNHVYHVQPRDVARAMDCSVRAIQVHLTAADSIVDKALPADAHALAEALRTYSSSLEVPAFYRAALARSTRRRWLKWVIIALVLVGGLVAGAVAMERSGVLDGIIGPRDDRGAASGVVE